MDAPWRIELLGWLRATQGDRVVSRFRTHKTGALLAHLAFYCHRSHPREVLIELLWPEVLPAAGRQSLRKALSSLRLQLEPPGLVAGAVIRADQETVQLNPAAISTDVGQFEAALRAATRVGSVPEQAPHLTAAVDLYRGELLPGYYADWILPERQRLSGAYLEALRQLLVLREEAGDLHGALHWARRAVAADPLGEEARQNLIRLLTAAGQPEAALREHREVERLLGQELGAEPDGEIRCLSRHREPVPAERLFQAQYEGMVQRDFPPPVAPPEPMGSIPLQFTRFFGREEEIAQVSEMLLGEGVSDAGWGISHSGSPLDSIPIQNPKSKIQNRLVTLTGPGGSGKTRLALEAAQRLRDSFSGSVWFVPLVDVSDPRLIFDKMLDAVRQPRAPRIEPVEQVVAFLSRQPSLLLLDNFEHLLSQGASLVQTLLERAETLTILVTSRQRLELPAEREFPVAPLPVPEASVFGVRSSGFGAPPPKAEHPTPNTEHLVQFPSVRLFIDRAQQTRPDFEVTRANAPAVAELCRRLEGLPLAIELAAARVGVLTPAQILARLEQRFELLVSRRQADPRHRSLRATLDWSYQLLSPKLQQVFKQVSIFRGGWSLAAAEVICETPRALDHLEQLKESSQIVTATDGDEMRFRLLETLREYGAEQLTAEESALLARRHARYFLELAETTEPQLSGANQVEWLERLDREHDNLRAALAWCAASGDSVFECLVLETSHEGDLKTRIPECPPPFEIGLRLSGALRKFWAVRGHLSEGRRWLEAALARSGSRPSPARAKALIAAGELAWHQGDHGIGRSLAEQGLSIAKQIGDKHHLAAAHGTLGFIAHFQGDCVSSRRHQEKGETLCRELGDEDGLAGSLFLRGHVAQAQGDLNTVRSYYEESLVIRRRLGDRGGMAWLLINLAATLRMLGEYDLAFLHAEECLAIFRESGNRWGAACSCHELGRLARARGDAAAAHSHYEAAQTIFRELGDKWGTAGLLFDLGDLVRDEGDLATARAQFEDSLALQREIGNKASVAGALSVLQEVAQRQDDEIAARAFGTENLALARELGDMSRNP